MGKSAGDRPVVLVTGAGSGIGRAIADRFDAAGWRVHVGDSDPEAVRQFLDEMPAASASVADVSRVADVETMFSDVRARYGRLDVLVNNAGISGPTAPVEEISPADWDRTIAVDLNGQFYCARLAVPLLKTAGGGSILLVSSSAAFFGYPLRTPYTACKWALIGFMKTLAMELGPYRIRVNAICPGSVRGARIDGVARCGEARPDCGGDQAALRVSGVPPVVRRCGGHRKRGVLPRLRRRRDDLGAGARRGRSHGITIQLAGLTWQLTK